MDNNSSHLIQSIFVFKINEINEDDTDILSVS